MPKMIATLNRERKSTTNQVAYKSLAKNYISHLEVQPRKSEAVSL